MLTYRQTLWQSGKSAAHYRLYSWYTFKLIITQSLQFVRYN